MLDLQTFCNSGSKAIDKPFTFEGYTYATNGHILVRVPECGEYKNRMPVGADKLPFDHDLLTSWQSLPTVKIETWTCGLCKGCGVVRVCEECNGEGDVELESSFNDYTCECKNCDGEGFFPGGKMDVDKRCPSCEGEGELVRSSAVDIGRNDGEGLNAIYLKKLSVLPEIEISAEGDNYSPFRFRFDGGCGVVMPMRM